MPSFGGAMHKFMKTVGIDEGSSSSQHQQQYQQPPQQPYYQSGPPPPPSQQPQYNAQQASPGGKVTVGYYPNWAIYDRKYKPHDVSRKYPAQRQSSAHHVLRLSARCPCTTLHSDPRSIPHTSPVLLCGHQDGQRTSIPH